MRRAPGRAWFRCALDSCSRSPAARAKMIPPFASASAVRSVRDASICQIHRLDWLELVRFIVDTKSIEGPVNAPRRPGDQRRVLHALGHALRRPSFMRAPSRAAHTRRRAVRQHPHRPRAIPRKRSRTDITSATRRSKLLSGFEIEKVLVRPTAQGTGAVLKLRCIGAGATGHSALASPRAPAPKAPAPEAPEAPKPAPGAPKPRRPLAPARGPLAPSRSCR